MDMGNTALWDSGDDEGRVLVEWTQGGFCYTQVTKPVILGQFSLSVPETRWPSGYVKEWELCLHQPWPPVGHSGASGPVTPGGQLGASKFPRVARARVLLFNSSWSC